MGRRLCYLPREQKDFRGKFQGEVRRRYCLNLTWPGDSQRESGRFARIDSQRNHYFHNERAIRANCLTLSQTCDSQLLAPRSVIRKKGFSSGTLERFARIGRFARICWAVIWGGAKRMGGGKRTRERALPKIFGSLEKSFWSALSWISVQEKQSADT